LKFDPDAAERRLLRASWVAVVGFSLLAVPWGMSVVTAVAAGGILASLNVEGIARLVHVVTSTSPERATGLAVVGVGFRFILLGVGLFVMISVWHANVVAVSVGLSAPVAAVLLEWGLDSMREFRSR
jgi:ATP synthase I chain